MFHRLRYFKYNFYIMLVLNLIAGLIFLYKFDFTNSHSTPSYNYSSVAAAERSSVNLTAELKFTGFYRINKNTYIHQASNLTFNSYNQKWSSNPNSVPEARYWNVADLFQANATNHTPHPLKNFTIVILTFSRIETMIANLKSLNNLERLDKVVIIWNSPVLPNKNITWPILHVPVHVYLAEKNSLNNRFLPFDVIETDAILSLDDDISLSHNEILFAFRGWREHQKRIVGFPSKGVQWDSKNNKWLYNPGSCMVNFILAGAAFIHKMYYYLYTYEMPSVIRDKVDELLNCEDLAMNFLVSNRTGKPPIKVTLKSDFSCPKCSTAEVSSSLSLHQKHYDERDDCINYFTHVYGYIPLYSSYYC